MGGPLAIVPACDTGWRVSDDTVQHVATLQALADHADAFPMTSAEDGGDAAAFDRVMASMAARHVTSWSRMGGRAPGNTCRKGARLLQAAEGRWRGVVPFSGAENAGCGAAMRAMGIGAALPGPHNRGIMVALAAESAGLSHHSVAGCFSAVLSAGGCALASEGVPASEWPARFVDELLPLTRRHLLRRKGGTGDVPAASVEELVRLAARPWEAHRADPTLRLRPAAAQRAADRDEAFRAVGHGWDAVSSVLIAWDALQAAQAQAAEEGLGAEEEWGLLLRASAAHGGDSDSTATIAGAWFGAAHGAEALRGAGGRQAAAVEFRAEILALAERLDTVAARSGAP